MSLKDFQSLLQWSSLGRYHQELLIRISSSGLDILAASPDGRIETYCSFNEYFVEQVATNSEQNEAIYATFLVEDIFKIFEQFQAALGDETPFISVYFLGHEFGVKATRVRFEGGTTKQAGLDLPEPKPPEVRPPILPLDVEGLKQEVGLSSLSELTERADIPRSTIKRFVESDRPIITSGDAGSPPKLVSEEHEPPLPLSNEWKESWLQPIELLDRFDQSNVLNLEEDETLRPVPIRIETTLEKLRHFHDIVEERPREPFVVKVENTSWIIEYGEERNDVRIRGTIPANVTNRLDREVSNHYGDGFEQVVENLPRGKKGEQVELQTAPGGPLAFVLRNRASGVVVRHVIQSPGT